MVSLKFSAAVDRGVDCTRFAFVPLQAGSAACQLLVCCTRPTTLGIMPPVKDLPLDCLELALFIGTGLLLDCRSCTRRSWESQSGRVWVVAGATRSWRAAREVRTGRGKGEALRRLSNALVAKRGHFRYESGHHGDLWLDLGICSAADPASIEPLVACMSGELGPSSRHRMRTDGRGRISWRCWLQGSSMPKFVYAERIEHPENRDLFPVEYRIPAALRDSIRGKRVAIVNDVINAGSAVRGTCRRPESQRRGDRRHRQPRRRLARPRPNLPTSTACRSTNSRHSKPAFGRPTIANSAAKACR